MKTTVRPVRTIALMVTASRLTAGETLVVHGHAQQTADGPVLLSLSAIRAAEPIHPFITWTVGERGVTTSDDWEAPNA